jgi:Ca-activated chloride channel family protein
MSSARGRGLAQRTKSATILNDMLAMTSCLPVLLVFCITASAQFHAESNLQSIAAQVTDSRGNSLTGLRVEDFTLLEDGRPQTIAFFGAERQPVSLAILLDSSRSMNFGGKFQRAQTLLAPLLRADRAGDEIFLVPFTDQVEEFRQLTEEERLHPPLPNKPAPDSGTALYDALATTLCHMKFAQNRRRAIVVVTDGADQHSRLSLDQVVGFAQTSSAQIFTIGFFEKSEYDGYRRTKTVTLQGEREIDNPLIVFERLAKESGAEAFFPTSDGDLKRAFDRISSILEAQYTLAYYPSNIDRFRRIEVRVNRPGAKVAARRGFGPDESALPVHFTAGSCAVSREDHPYPWEPHLSTRPSGVTVWRDDFADIHSGWPSRPDDHSLERAAFGYTPEGYEITFHLSPRTTPSPGLKGDVVAYGLVWRDFNASVLVQSDWTRMLPKVPSVLQSTPYNMLYGIAAGIVFHMGPEGYYTFLLTGNDARRTVSKADEKHLRFALLRRYWNGQQTEIIPWTAVAGIGVGLPATPVHKIRVEYTRGEIALFVDDHEVGLPEGSSLTAIRRVTDTTFEDGLMGFGVFGDGRALYRDLVVEGPE